MKRLLLVLAIALLPSGALFAQASAPERDVLLTPEGTLYTIESESSENYPDANARSQQLLVLTSQTGDQSTKTIVPDSLEPGLHRRPALAYDSDSKTLFIFWLKTPNAMSSELLVSSYQNGKWRSATSILGDTPMTFRYNLRIAVTRHVAQVQRDGSFSDVPMVIVHVVWWESTANGEVARYAMLPVDHDALLITDPKEQIHNLSDFVSVPDSTYDVSDSFNREILRHPAILDNGTTNSVDVVFGDAQTNSFNRTTLKPILEGRLHIPVGRDKGGRPTRMPAPQDFSSDWNGRIATLGSGHGGDSLVLYTAGDSSVSYVMYSNGKWSTEKTIQLNGRLSVDAAVGALGKMLSASE